MAEDPKPTAGCVLGARNAEKLVSHHQWITALESRQGKMGDILDKVRNRLPVWATAVMMVLTGIIGWLLK